MGVSKRWVPTVGIVGAGEMGKAIALKLMSSKYVLNIYDTNPVALNEFSGSGVLISESVEKLVSTAFVIITALPISETFVSVVEQKLVPEMRSGRIIIDIGDSDVEETKRLALLCSTKGAQLLDAPAVGGPRGAAKGALNIFCGGHRETFDKVAALLKILGGLGSVSYCGPSGAGQAMRCAHQMAVGLCSAAMLETLAFAGKHGLTPQQVAETLDRSPAAKAGFEGTTKRFLQKGGGEVGLEYDALRECLLHHPNSLPLTRALLTYLQKAPATLVEHNHLVPSYWNELTKKTTPK